MICKEKRIGLPWFSTNPQIMTLFSLLSKQGRHPADIFNWTNNWTCLWIFRGELPHCSPPDCGISCRTCQHHLETRASNVWDRVQSDH